MTSSGRASVLPAVAALMLNAVVWGVSWWPFRHLQAHGLHPLWATAAIYMVSVTCVLVLWPHAWRSFSAHPMLWLLTLASGLTNVGFNWAVTVGDVVRVVLLFYLMPAWAVLLAWLLDPASVPPGAVIQGLGTVSWEQTQRRLGQDLEIQDTKGLLLKDWPPALAARDCLVTLRKPAAAKLNARYVRNDKDQVVLRTIEEAAP